MPKFIDLTGKQFGNWRVSKYIGKSVWECINEKTLQIKNIHSYDLRNKYLNGNKEYNPKEVEDLKDKCFGEWEVLEYIGGNNGAWKCKCSCGKEGTVSGYDLRNGKSTHCNNPIHSMENLQNKKFGEWTVQNYAGNMRWHCICSCGKEKDVLGRYLKDGTSKSCGHDREHHLIYKDLKGKQFGYLKVIEYTGKDQMWRCLCTNCGKIKDIFRDSLVSGKTKSCGCLKESMRISTLYNRYGDTNTTRIDTPRENWQIEATTSRESLKTVIDKLDHKPTVWEISNLLDINETAVTKMLKKFDMTEYISEWHGVSDQETSVFNFIKSIYTGEIVKSDRTVLGGQELDIYVPEKHIAIEFNGSYWHSDIFKTKKYHQQKTIECIQKGIHLIHIFEYEWQDAMQRNKIMKYLEFLLSNSKQKIQARQTKVDIISTEEAKQFLEEYHLQGYTPAKTQIGLTYNNRLIGVMTFGAPRFNNSFEYELIRLCYVSDLTVIGGTEKMFKFFINLHNPESIISYCDITKFSGDTYIKLGFETSKDKLTEPNYVWVDKRNNKVLTRYQTKKADLVKAGLGNKEDTEDKIMSSLGYFKVYNSGNIKFTWVKNK